MICSPALTVLAGLLSLPSPLMVDWISALVSLLLCVGSLCKRGAYLVFNVLIPCLHLY